MARAWPSLGRRTRVPPDLVGQAALALVLVLALAFSSRDVGPSERYVYAFGPAPSGIALMQVSGNNLYAGKSHIVPKPPVVTPPPQPVIPTARPVQLLIPSLDVHRAVESVGANRNGVMNLPANSWNAGWYRPGPVPGAPGDAVIEGHAGYPGQPMIFGRLVNLRPGAKIVVVLADGSRQLFLAQSIGSVPVGTGPPGMAEPYGPPRLTLITCTGHFDKNTYSYSSRLVVEASYAGPV